MTHTDDTGALMTTDRAEPHTSRPAAGRARQPAVPPGVEYHRILAGTRRRIGRGVLAIALLLGGLVIFPTGLGYLGAAVDAQWGNSTPIVGGTDYTWLYHATSMASLALLVPWSMLIQRRLYGVRGATLSSIASCFRPAMVGRTLLLVGPVWVVAVGITYLGPGGQEAPWSYTDLLGVVLVTLLLTPLQVAGEEYGLRGLLLRVTGGWTRGGRAGLVLGVAVSSVIFTMLHGSANPYVLAWYFTLSVSLALVTWRTGGLEVAVVLHAVLNVMTFLMATALRVDVAGAFADRSTAGTPLQLVPAAVAAAVAAVVWWRTQRAGPAVTPGSSQ